MCPWDSVGEDSSQWRSKRHFRGIPREERAQIVPQCKNEQITKPLMTWVQVGGLITETSIAFTNNFLTASLQRTNALSVRQVHGLPNMCVLLFGTLLEGGNTREGCLELFEATQVVQHTFQIPIKVETKSTKNDSPKFRNQHSLLYL